MNNFDSDEADEKLGIYKTESDEEEAMVVLQPQKEKKTFNVILKLINILQKPWKLLFYYTIPYNIFPTISFLIIMCYVYCATRYLIYGVDQIIAKLNVSHAFVGLTFTSWGGNLSDIVNASVAAQNLKTELATSTIIGSQIINLQLCLGLPWMLYNLTYGILYFNQKNIFSSILVGFIMVIISLAIMTQQQFQLNRYLGIQLILVYVIYCIFEYKFNCA